MRNLHDKYRINPDFKVDAVFWQNSDVMSCDLILGGKLANQ